MDPTLLKVKEVYVPTGNSRGRKKKDPSELKSKPYIKTGKPKGRPRKELKCEM